MSRTEAEQLVTCVISLVYLSALAQPRSLPRGRKGAGARAVRAGSPENCGRGKGRLMFIPEVRTSRGLRVQG